MSTYIITYDSGAPNYKSGVTEEIKSSSPAGAIATLMQREKIDCITKIQKKRRYDMLVAITGFKFNGIAFDDVTMDEDGHYWSQICKSCAEKHNMPDSLLDECGSGICGVQGCENEADYYIDFPNRKDDTNA